MPVPFQSGTLATPPVGTVIATDRVLSGGIGTEFQQIKIDVGPAGTSVIASYAAGTGLPVQGVGTFQALGTFQAHGTSQILGTVQTAGTSQVIGTVRTLTPTYIGESFFGSTFTAGVTNGTLVPAPGVGTFVRVFDLLVNGSASGTAFFEMGDGTVFGHVFLAANGGWSFNSSKGVRTKAANLDILFNAAAGTWGVAVNYTLET